MSENHWADIERTVEEFIKSKFSDDVLEQNAFMKLEELKSLVCQDVFRSSIPESVLLKLSCILNQKSKLLLPCLESLRNCYGKNWEDCPSTWSIILQQIINIISSKESLEFLVSDADVVPIRIALQFIGNLLNTQPAIVETVWENLKNCFECLFINSDEKIRLYSSFVMYGLLRNSSAIRKQIITSNWKSFSSKLIESSHNGIIFSQYSIQLFLKDLDLITELYSLHDLECRLYLLHQIAEFITDCEFDVKNWQFITQLFIERCSVILRTFESNSVDLEALEVMALVEILAKGSANDLYRVELSQQEDLLGTTISMLKGIHELGKSGSNYFSTIDHFEPVDQHPSLGLKANLVRLLGNLSYRNPSVQDRIRELDAVPTILECCKLDARNILIQQWSILAIRNLCEVNTANQELIASFQRMGVVQPDILANSGLVVEDTANGLKLRKTQNGYERDN